MWYTWFFPLIDLQLFYHVLQKKLENTEAYAVTLLASVEVSNKECNIVRENLPASVFEPQQNAVRQSNEEIEVMS